MLNKNISQNNVILITKNFWNKTYIHSFTLSFPFMHFQLSICFFINSKWEGQWILIPQGPSRIKWKYILLHCLSLVSWGCKICQLHHCGRERLPQMSVLHMASNNLMVRLQWCWSFVDCGKSLYCDCSQVDTGLEWYHLIGSYLWIK